MGLCRCRDGLSNFILPQHIIINHHHYVSRRPLSSLRLYAWQAYGDYHSSVILYGRRTRCKWISFYIEFEYWNCSSFYCLVVLWITLNTSYELLGCGATISFYQDSLVLITYQALPANAIRCVFLSAWSSKREPTLLSVHEVKPMRYTFILTRDSTRSVWIIWNTNRHDKITRYNSKNDVAFRKSRKSQHVFQNESWKWIMYISFVTTFHWNLSNKL